MFRGQDPVKARDPIEAQNPIVDQVAVKDQDSDIDTHSLLLEMLSHLTSCKA